MGCKVSTYTGSKQLQQFLFMGNIQPCTHPGGRYSFISSQNKCSQAARRFTDCTVSFPCKLLWRKTSHRPNYKCLVSSWKVHFWCFLWKRKRAVIGCGGVLCGLPTSSPPGSCERGPFLCDNKLRWEGSWSPGLVSLSEVVLFLFSWAYFTHFVSSSFPQRILSK